MTREDADRKTQRLSRVTFVRWTRPCMPATGMAPLSRWNSFPDARWLSLRNTDLAYGISWRQPIVGECAKPGTKNERNRGGECLRKNEVGGCRRVDSPSVTLFADTVPTFCEAKALWAFGLGVFFRAHEKIPTMEADIRFAMVPASRPMPNLRVGCAAPAPSARSADLVRWN